ncbi:MAG: TIGR04282 family arsenosugar biosynthesis glycosyltransferase [Desulforhopalus sp.]
MLTNCKILLFTRYPEKGKTKTRLIGELGADGAALLHKKLTERVFMQASLLKQRSGIETIVYFCGGSSPKMTSWLGPIHCVEQMSGDLGQKMRSAFEHCFSGGAETAILIGSDIPDISAELLQQAFNALITKDVVIGPSRDGGYYLIGMAAGAARICRPEGMPPLLPLLFDKMKWSTEELFNNTMHRLESAGYETAHLPTLRDIDIPADLPFAKEKGLL